MARLHFSERTARSALQALARVVVPLVCKPTIEGHIAPDTKILAGNHVGHLDPFLLMYAASKQGFRPRFMVTKNLLKLPVVGSIVRHAGYQGVTFVERNSRVVDTEQTDIAGLVANGVKAINRGEILAGYPGAQITRTDDLRPERLRSGIPRIALQTGAKVQPVAHLGAHNLLAFDENVGKTIGNIVRAVFRRPPVVISFGTALKFDSQQAAVEKTEYRQGLRILKTGATHAATVQLGTALDEHHQDVVARHPGLNVITDPSRPINNGRAIRQPA